MLAVSALSGAYPRLLVDRVPGQGTGRLPERRPAGRPVNYRPAVPEVRRYLARESAKFIARSREWYVIMPLYFTNLPTSNSRNRDKITGERPPSCRSATHRLPSLRIFLLAREIFIFLFSDLRSASDNEEIFILSKRSEIASELFEREKFTDWCD